MSLQLSKSRIHVKSDSLILSKLDLDLMSLSVFADFQSNTAYQVLAAQAQF